MYMPPALDTPDVNQINAKLIQTAKLDFMDHLFIHISRNSKISFRGTSGYYVFWDWFNRDGFKIKFCKCVQKMSAGRSSIESLDTLDFFW
jgi:hypothetical protein